jgi:hypothetical protein
MKSNLIKTLFNKQIRELLINRDLEYKNHLLYHEIKSGLLRGFCFNSSAFSANQFEIVAFVMPSYISIDFIALTFGHSLRTPNKRQWWEYDEDKSEQIGLELAAVINQAEEDFLSKINDAASFYRYYKKDRKNTFRFFEAVSYSAAYAELAGADDDLKDCLSFIRNKEDMSNVYVKQVYSNTEKLFAGNRKVILNEWETVTRKALKL